MVGLSMRIIAHLRKHIKGQALLSILICLFISIAVVPELSQSTNNESAPVSISAVPYSIDYALLPVPLRIGENFHGVKANKNDAFGQRVSAPLAVLPASLHYVPNPHSFVNFVGDFYNISTRDLRQACQLLDLPPPGIFS